MLVGVLIGLVLTALTVLLSAIIGKKNFGPLSYVVIAVALIFFCIEGISIVSDINVRRSIDTLEPLLQTTREFLAFDDEEHRLSKMEATGVVAGLKLAYPQMAKYLKPSDVTGHSISESVILIRQKLQHDTAHHLWETIIWVIVVIGLTMAFIAVFSNSYNGQHKRNRLHGRAPRNYHRGGRR